MHFPKITLILPGHPAWDELHLLHQLFEAGLECLWLRRPEVDHLLALHNAIDPQYHSRLLLPFDFWKMYGRQVDLYGVHCSGYLRNSLTGDDLNALQECDHVSTSIHSSGELESLAPIFTQVMVSPLFDSISKAGYHANAEIWEVAALRPEICKIGLGGIKPENAAQVMQNGFHGVALIGSIWEAADPVAQFKILHHILENQSPEPQNEQNTTTETASHFPREHPERAG